MKNEFMEKAVQVVSVTEPSFEREELYIVWFCKTLRNWKALVSTDAVDGLYWEVTYNGDKEETYVDRYVKSTNVAVSNSELGE